jgi:sulfite exporter TauE/SafE
MNFGIAIALGLLGSLHCAAMCGPLMLALPVPPGGPGRFVAGRVIYQAGRIATYALLGVLAGLLGKSFFLAGWQRWLSIAIGLAILLGYLFSGRMALTAPVVRLVGRLKAAMSWQLQQRSLRSLALLGMLNGLLPCGLVYVAVAGAICAGTWMDGLIYMALFGLGTTPAMLGIALCRKAFPAAVRLRLRSVVPYAVCSLGILLVLRGMGLGIPYVSPALAGGVPVCCIH